jgi:hypothetical protein
MAELGLGIVGIALAWKGIMDFGELVSTLMADDGWRREGLAMKLEASHFMLKDWGECWELTSKNGRFHDFEPARRELITRIIFRLRDSRTNAQKRLKEYYGLPADKGETNGDDSHKRLSKLVDRVRGASRSARNKTVWLIHDRDLITDLVNETVELHESLNYLTHLSPKFLLGMQSSLRSSPSLDSSLLRIESKVEEMSRNLSQHTLRSSSQEHPDVEMDVQTVAGYATRSITSSTQANRVQQLLNEGRHHWGDTRITDQITMWWAHDGSRLLVIEGQDLSMDTTYASVLLYSMVPCRKLIHTLDPESTTDPLVRFIDMLRTLMRNMVSLAGDLPLDVTVSITDTDPNNMATGEHYIRVFLKLLENLVTHCDKALLLVVDRMDLVSVEVEAHPDLYRLVRQFVSGLNALCTSHDGAVLKVLLGYNGYAMIVYDCMEYGDIWDIADFTDHASDNGSMWEELQPILRDAD